MKEKDKNVIDLKKNTDLEVGELKEKVKNLEEKNTSELEELKAKNRILASEIDILKNEKIFLDKENEEKINLLNEENSKEKSLRKILKMKI